MTTVNQCDAMCAIFFSLSMNDLTSTSRRVQLVLQESHVLQEWEQGERLERSEPLSFRIAIQDSASFPSLQENYFTLNAGAEHTILVGIYINVSAKI